MMGCHGEQLAFAALRQDGRVFAWGSSGSGGSIPSSVSSELINVQTIYSTSGAFAALRQDGRVFAQTPRLWRQHSKQCVESSSTCRPSTPIAMLSQPCGRTGVWLPGEIPGFEAAFQAVCRVSSSTCRPFTALKCFRSLAGRRVVAWGVPDYGGSIPSIVSSELINVQTIYSTGMLSQPCGRTGVWLPGEAQTMEAVFQAMCRVSSSTLR